MPLKEEFPKRIDALRSIMEKQSIDVVIAHSSDHFMADSVRYLSNFDIYAPCGLVIIPREEDPALVIGFNPNYIPRVKAISWIPYIKAGTQPYQFTKRILEAIPLDNKRIGIIGGDDMPYYIWDPLRKDYTDFDFVDLTPELDKMRIIKTDEEIKHIRKAADICSSAMNDFISMQKPARAELEIFADLARNMREMGCDLIDRENILFLAASGPEEICRPPKPYPGLRVINVDDPIIAAWTVQYQGYWTSIGRTLCDVGCQKLQKEIYSKAYNIHQKIIEMIKPGALCKDIAVQGRKILVDEGFQDFIYYEFGYGLGLNVQERPFLTPQSNDILEPGMVLRVGFDIAVPNQGGALNIDTVLVTEDGCEVLTAVE